MSRVFEDTYVSGIYENFREMIYLTLQEKYRERKIYPDNPCT
jgi:hypothetical protein